MWIAQDEDGTIFKYKSEPEESAGYWTGSIEEQICFAKNWQSSLINLETHDYRIEDGILVKVEKKTDEQKVIDALNTAKIEVQFKHNGDFGWIDLNMSSVEYRIKPKTKTVRFRNYLDMHNIPRICRDEAPYPVVNEWIGDWKSVEVPE